MHDYQRYGIAVGQIYEPASGARGRIVVRDVETYADCGDVVVFDEAQGIERRIDAFKLAMVRYCLVDVEEEADKREMLQAMREGRASPEQQKRMASVLQAMEEDMNFQLYYARRGKYVGDHGELHTEPDGKQTWLCVRVVAPGAALDNRASRMMALDAAIYQSEDIS